MQYPKRVTIELTNRCNRQCQGCPRHKMIYSQGDMSVGLFNKIVKQLPNSTIIVPFFRGEPTLHKHFPEYMSKLNRFKEIQLASNGDYLTPENRRAILDNCTFISLSLHEYKFPNETNWLPFLYDCLGVGVETQVSILETMLPAKPKAFTKAWKKHVDRVRIYKEHSRNGFGSMTEHASNNPCSKPFEEIVVFWDGQVGLCNHDWNNLCGMGDLNKQSIQEVFNGWEYKLIRDYHMQGKRREVLSCRDCDFQSYKVYGEIYNGR